MTLLKNVCVSLLRLWESNHLARVLENWLLPVLFNVGVVVKKVVLQRVNVAKIQVFKTRN